MRKNSLFFCLFFCLCTSFVVAGVKIYYYYDPLHDSYVFTNVCENMSECKPLLIEKGTIIHKKGYRLKPGAESAFDEHINRAAERYGLDFHLIKSLIKAESLFDRDAKSSKGAIGLMQLMPDTARMLRVDDPYDPAQNIMGGTKFLRDMIHKFKDYRKALAAYNAGPAAVVYYDGIPPYKETQGYVEKIRTYYQEYTGKSF